MHTDGPEAKAATTITEEYLCDGNKCCSPVSEPAEMVERATKIILAANREHYGPLLRELKDFIDQVVPPNYIVQNDPRWQFVLALDAELIRMEGDNT